MNLGPIVDQFMDNATMYFEEALDSDDPVALRAKALALQDARYRIFRRLSSLESALNAKASSK
jgi:hypothetical protein